jgi:putative addiction module component (TIGR02574 family)
MPVIATAQCASAIVADVFTYSKRNERQCRSQKEKAVEIGKTLAESGVKNVLSCARQSVRIPLIMQSIDELTAEVLKLPTDQQFTLVQKVLQNIEAEPSARVDGAWDAEIRNRIERYRAGQVMTIPGSEVFKELDRKLR